MKKLSALILIIVLMVSFGACSMLSKDPMEKVNNFITENGTQKGEEYVLEYPDAVNRMQESSFTIAAMKNLKGSAKSEFKMIKDADGISVELVDSSITDNGLKMERSVVINADGTFEYYNGLTMNGTELGVRLEGEIPVEAYDKEKAPVITKSKFATGAKMSDEVKSTLKDYIDLTLDCYAEALAQDGLGVTLADMGYAAYEVAE